MTIASILSRGQPPAERASQRELERQLDRELRQPPAHGRRWSEHTPGLHGPCARCGRVGRRWRGAFITGPVVGALPYAIHSSPPLCVWHVIELQRAEWGIPLWRTVSP